MISDAAQKMKFSLIIFFGNPKALVSFYNQKQTSRGVLRKKFSENMQEIYKRTPMPKCDFNKVAKQTADLVTFTEEILNGKLLFLGSDCKYHHYFATVY